MFGKPYIYMPSELSCPLCRIGLYGE